MADSQPVLGIQNSNINHYPKSTQINFIGEKPH